MQSNRGAQLGQQQGPQLHEDGVPVAATEHSKS